MSILGGGRVNDIGVPGLVDKAGNSLEGFGIGFGFGFGPPGGEHFKGFMSRVGGVGHDLSCSLQRPGGCGSWRDSRLHPITFSA